MNGARFFGALMGIFGASVCGAQERFDCVIDPSAQVNLGSPVPGLIEAVLVDRGDWVQAGQVVAQLYADRENATVELLTLRATSTAEIEAQQARLKLAEQSFERAKNLKDRGVATNEVMEQREAALQVALRDYSEAKLRQELAALELERAKIIAEERKIRSPISGFVINRMLNPGEYLDADVGVLEIAQIDPLRVEAFVDAEKYEEISVGAFGLVYPTSLEAEPSEAEILVVDRVFDATSDTFGVRLRLSNSDFSIPAGQRCQVSFEGLDQ